MNISFSDQHQKEGFSFNRIQRDIEFEQYISYAIPFSNIDLGIINRWLCIFWYFYILLFFIRFELVEAKMATDTGAIGGSVVQQQPHKRAQ